MRILGIETSCDETAVAVVENGVTVRSSIIASSKATFEALAGVIPEQAARAQVECMIPVLHQAVQEAKLTLFDIDAIAVTKGPGLLGSLLVGTVTARMLQSITGKPLIGVHHTLGHLSSTWLEVTDEPQFPLLTLSASGGHTDLWYRESHLRGILAGRTRDDAAGEAFDKGASMLGLPYPGGPEIAKEAVGGNPLAFAFPLPLRGEETLDYSFSGLKTSLRYTIRDAGYDLDTPIPASVRKDLAASYQHALCAHLVDRISYALEGFPDTQEVHVVGGVSANTELRAMLALVLEKKSPSLILRAPKKLAYCTDNAAMIAAAGYFLWLEQHEKAYEAFATQASLPLAETLMQISLRTRGE